MTIEQRLAVAFLEEHPELAARTLERMTVEARVGVVTAFPAESAR